MTKIDPPATGRRSEDREVEITPEMIEAGVAVLYCFETETADEAYWARRIFVAMRLAEDQVPATL